MDGHSAMLQAVGCAFYEPKIGRTKLCSLADYDTESDTMYISSFHIDDEYKKDGASDIGAAALCQFLHHPFINGDLPSGAWRVSSIVYDLDPREAMSKEERTAEDEENKEASLDLPWEPKPETDADRDAKAEKEGRDDELARQDAIQFLGNGFFQDPALARHHEQRCLVASYRHWSQATPILSHAEAEAIQFYAPPATPPAPRGKDAEILNLVKKTCSKHETLQSTELAGLLDKIACLVAEGGSVSRSNALHAACKNNDKLVLSALLPCRKRN